MLRAQCLDCISKADTALRHIVYTSSHSIVVVPTFYIERLHLSRCVYLDGRCSSQMVPSRTRRVLTSLLTRRWTDTTDWWKNPLWTAAATTSTTTPRTLRLSWIPTSRGAWCVTRIYPLTSCVVRH
jgi:hypothetical protein